MVTVSRLTLTLKEIAESAELFDKYEHHIHIAELGDCKLVAIHGLDSSTKAQYSGHDNATLTSLMVDGSSQVKLMLDNDVHFNVNKLR